MDNFYTNYEHPFTEKPSMVVHGDDNLAVAEGHYGSAALDRLKENMISYYLSIGWTAKVKISTDWECVEFCSSLFWPVEGGYVLGPKIGKRLPKIGFSLKKLTLGEVKGMLIGLSIEAGHVPVVRKYAEKCLAKLDHVEVEHVVDARSKYKSLPVSAHKCCDETDVFFLSRYGITIEDAEEELEAILFGDLLVCTEFKYLPFFTEVDL